jgi:hypothetical protein
LRRVNSLQPVPSTFNASMERPDETGAQYAYSLYSLLIQKLRYFVTLNFCFPLSVTIFSINMRSRNLKSTNASCLVFITINFLDELATTFRHSDDKHVSTLRFPFLLIYKAKTSITREKLTKVLDICVLLFQKVLFWLAYTATVRWEFYFVQNWT